MTAVESKTESDTITVRNPADGSVAGTVPIDLDDTVAAKAQELRRAQPECEAIVHRGRKKWLLQYQGWILDNVKKITEVLISETGKSEPDAGVEAVLAADLLNYWASNAEEFLADRHPKAHSPLY